MTKLQTIALPPEVTDGFVILRHYLVLDDGTVWFQDEGLHSLRGGVVKSTRTDWEQLPTPPSASPVVGLIDFGGMPMAMRANGQAYLWGQVKMDLPDKGEVMVDVWAPFLNPVPTHGREDAEKA